MIITKKRFNGLLEQIADLQVDNATLMGQLSYSNNQIRVLKTENQGLKELIEELKKNRQEDKPKRKVGRPRKESK